MSKPIEHEFCEHGICLKCERCDMCAGIKEGKMAAFKIIDELLTERTEP
jgi:hypothetical protein